MNKVLTVILTVVVSVGLIAYALSLTSPEETITPGNHQLEARPQEVPKESASELKPEEPGNIEAGDGVEVLEAPEPLPFKMSNGAEKVLREKLKEAKSMAKSRKRWIEETKIEISDLKELINSVPENSELHKEFASDLDRKEHYLKTQYTRLAEGEKEIMLIEAALGGK